MSNADDLKARAQSLRSLLPESRARQPPEERGRRLAVLPRPREDAEIRLVWDHYEGHPYISIRVWCKGDDGQMWPDKHNGMSIRLRELPDVASAIAEALTMAEEHLRARPQPSRGSQPRDDRGRRGYDPSTLPGINTQSSFDEFNSGR